MKLHLVVGLGFVGLGLLSAGCGNISITGALGERVLRATGTVAAWVDASTFEPGADGSAQRIDRVTDSTELHLEFFESVFDSRAAVGAVSAAESSALVDDINGGVVGSFDDALALWFPAPRSETGEDVAELQAHGGGAAPPALAAAPDWVVMAGARDPLYDFEPSRDFWLRTLPGAEVRIIPDGGRWLHLTHVDAIVAALASVTARC